MSTVESLKEELQESDNWKVTINVSRYDLEMLIKDYEKLKKKAKKKS